MGQSAQKRLKFSFSQISHSHLLFCGRKFNFLFFLHLKIFSHYFWSDVPLFLCFALRVYVFSFSSTLEKTGPCAPQGVFCKKAYSFQQKECQNNSIINLDLELPALDVLGAFDFQTLATNQSSGFAPEPI